MRITVITVVKNDLPGLVRTVKSVEAQTFGDIEHIVFDGLSVDGTSEWLLNHQSPLEKTIYRSQPDDGLYDAMNQAMKEMSGDLVLFLNAGDELYHQSTLADVARDRAEKNWTWAYGVIERHTKGQVTGHSSKVKIKNRDFIAGKAWIPHQAAFLPVDLLRGNGFTYQKRFGMAADQDLMLKLVLLEPPFIMDLIVARFQNGGRHSQISPIRRELDWLEIRKQYASDGFLGALKISWWTVNHVVRGLRTIAKRQVRRLTRTA